MDFVNSFFSSLVFIFICSIVWLIPYQTSVYVEVHTKSYTSLEINHLFKPKEDVIEKEWETDQNR